MAKAKSITNIDAHAPTGRNARIIAKARLEEMYVWVIYIDDPANVLALHNLRIAAKRLRYTLEIFEETFPQQCESIIQEVTKIQEELGSIHDSDVMVALLQLCLNGYDSDVGYEYTLKDNVVEQQEQRKSMVDSAMLASLLDQRTIPTAEEREGLQLLLPRIQKQREEQYASFYQHWQQLSEQDFYHKVITLLDS